MTIMNDEDIQPLSAEEIKAIGEIELGPAKHEIFLNKHYKKLLWGGIGLGIAAGCVIAYFSHVNDKKQEAAAQVMAAVKLTAPAHGEASAAYDDAALTSLSEDYASTPSAETGKLLAGMKALSGANPEAGVAELETLAAKAKNSLIQARAQVAVAAYYLNNGQDDKAAEAWQKVAALGESPYAALAQVTLGDIARTKGDMDAARAAYTEAESKYPTSPLVTSKTVQMRLMMLDVDAPVPVAAPEKKDGENAMDAPSADNPFGDEAPATEEPTPSLDDLLK